MGEKLGTEPPITGASCFDVVFAFYVIFAYMHAHLNTPTHQHSHAFTQRNNHTQTQSHCLILNHTFGAATTASTYENWKPTSTRKLHSSEDARMKSTTALTRAPSWPATSPVSLGVCELLPQTPRRAGVCLECTALDALLATPPPGRTQRAAEGGCTNWQLPGVGARTGSSWG